MAPQPDFGASSASGKPNNEGCENTTEKTTLLQQELAHPQRGLG